MPIKEGGGVGEAKAKKKTSSKRKDEKKGEGGGVFYGYPPPARSKKVTEVYSPAPFPLPSSCVGRCAPLVAPMTDDRRGGQD